MLGGGIGLPRMSLISMSALGQALTDVVVSLFIVDTLRTLGASRFAALMALAAGSGASIFTAPLVGALGGRSVMMRKYTTIACYTIAASCAVAVAVLVGNHSPSSDGPRAVDITRAGIVFILSAVYRAATQSAPIVPMCIDAASTKVKGDAETANRRIAISLSFFYLNSRVGNLIVNIVLSALPERTVDRLLPILATAALLFFITIAITAFSMPSGPLEPQDEETERVPKPAPAAAPESALKVAWMDIKRVTLRGSTRLLLMYVTTFFYGIAWGQLVAVTAPFYNEVVFKRVVGAGKGIEWAAYSGLIAWAVGMMHDAAIGGIAFASPISSFGMTLFWVFELWLGVGFFVTLYFSSNKNVALVVFGLLTIAQSSQLFFSLVAGGALVDEPKLRPAAFGIRAASTQLGWLIGNVVSAVVVEREESFRPVMLLSASACAAGSVSAFAIGSVERPSFMGVATNANPLFSYLIRPNKQG